MIRPSSYRPGIGTPEQGNSARRDAPVDWQSWVRLVERKRRHLARAFPEVGYAPIPPDLYFERAGYVSFRLDDVAVTASEVASALLAHSRQHVRSRQSQRIRNHVAIARWIERDLHLKLPLRCEHVVRWYASISCGLCTANLPMAMMQRLDGVVRKINSPSTRLQTALGEVAQVHFELLTDPLVPSFNGLLARLLLRYHLGRCHLPPVLFDPESDRPTPASARAILDRLLELVPRGYDMLIEPTHPLHI